MIMASVRVDQRLLVTPLPRGTYFEETGKQELVFQVPDGLSVNEALESLNIRLNQGVVALIDGETIDLSRPLIGSQEVRLLPQISGGD